MAADRAGGRGGVGLGLGTALEGLAEQFLHIVRGLDFEMTEVLLTGTDEALERTFQRLRGADGEHGQRFLGEDRRRQG
jgi:hypothetical protein